MLYTKKINLKNKNDSLSRVFAMVENRTTVLDVGCACGDLSVALAKNKKCRVYGIEANPKSVAICKNANVFERIWCYDLNCFTSKDFLQYKGLFDVIICADVLEHLIKPDEFLKKVQFLLKPVTGKIIISLPNIAHASIKTNLLLDDFTYTEMGILDKTHLHFYTYKSIADLLTSVNLRIIKATTTSLPLDGWQPRKLSELPQKTADFIKKDKHSHVMQYIMLCEQKKIKKGYNLQCLENSVNTKTFNKKGSLISWIKRLLIVKFPKLISHIEQIIK